MIVHPWIWAAFVAALLALLAVDLFAHREERELSMREALVWVGIWVTLGLGFTFVVWAWQGGTVAGEYIAGYLIEYSLSVDNIFVFVLLLTYFVVPPEHQHRVLFWGIIGALVSRAAFILAGAALLHQFHFMEYLFGAFLVFTAGRMAIQGEVEVHPDRSLVLRGFRRLIPMTGGYRGSKFFVREEERRMATQLLAVLVVIEATYILFASNAFAILGLRSLYFVLHGMMRRFSYLQYGLSAVLCFVGVKMLISGVYVIPIWLSLVVIVAALSTSVIASLFVERRS